MKFGTALAILAVISLTPSVPATAAKDDKLPRCNARQKRPANLYGTVLPTLPDRMAPGAATSSSGAGVPRGTPSAQAVPAPATAPASTTTNLFPPASSTPAPQGSDTSQGGKVPAIGAVDAGAGSTAALPTSYASC